MKLCLLSDLHGYLPELPVCDAVLIAGDITPPDMGHPHALAVQREWLRDVFFPWMQSTRAPVVWTWGNHDWIGYAHHQSGEGLRGQPANSHLLVDQSTAIEHDGRLVNIHAIPWSLTFMNWAFMKDEKDMTAVCAAIPASTDILITHGPPRGKGDRTADGQRVGSAALDAKLKSLNVALVVTGHIHEAAGLSTADGATRPFDVVNASIRDLAYRVVRKPILYEFTLRHLTP